MKNRISYKYLHEAFGLGLCCMMLFGLSANVLAQEEDEVEEVTVRRVAKAPKKQYETKSIHGVITDDATGEAMGGVRIQALGLEQYSTLTEEDGSYKLDIPVFSDAVYVYAEGYNPMQIAVKDGEASGKLIVTTFSPFSYPIFCNIRRR